MARKTILQYGNYYDEIQSEIEQYVNIEYLSEYDLDYNSDDFDFVDEDNLSDDFLKSQEEIEKIIEEEELEKERLINNYENKIAEELKIKNWDEIIINPEFFGFGNKVYNTYNMLDGNGNTALDAAINTGNLSAYQYIMSNGGERSQDFEIIKNGTISDDEINKYMRRDILELIKNNVDNNVEYDDNNSGYFSAKTLLVSGVCHYNITFEELYNSKINSEYLIDFRFRSLTDFKGETLLDVANRYNDNELVEKLEKEGYMTSRSLLIDNSLRKFIEQEGIDLDHKNIIIGDKQFLSMAGAKFYVNGEMDGTISNQYRSWNDVFYTDNSYSITRDELLDALAVDIDKKFKDLEISEIIGSKISETLESFDYITLGQKLDIMMNDGFYDKAVHIGEYSDPIMRTIFSEFNNKVEITDELDYSTIKSWNDLIRDGSVERMVECLREHPEYLDIIDINNKTCLQAVIDVSDIELADKLSKIGAMTNEELEKEKEKPFDYEINHSRELDD